MKKTLNFIEIDRLAQNLANYVKKMDNLVIALIGDLGTGKTTFSKQFAKSFGINEELKSPTFNYVLEYFSNEKALYHFDVYRIDEPEEIYALGYEDYINSGISLIEWADKIETELPKKYIKIVFSYSLEEDKREVSLNFIGDEEKEKELLKYVDFRN